MSLTSRSGDQDRAAGPPLIRTHALSRSYRVGRQSVRALAGVDVEISDGESVAVVGPSGSGKTTLLNLIGGLDVPTSGSVVVGGHDLTTLSRDELARYRRGTVGFVFQSFRLLPHLTALENVALPLLLAGSGRVEAGSRARALLARVGLSDRERHRPAQLSAGEQQRVATARALAQGPKLLLADEPTGNLDAAAASEILDLFGELRARDGLTIVVATHNAEVAARADRVVALRAGRVEVGAPA